jgi:hypothetical protein
MFEYVAMVEISLFLWNMVMEILGHLQYLCYMLRSYDASEALSHWDCVCVF